LIVHAEVILGDVRQAGRTGILALGEGLPRNRPPSVPPRLAAAVARAAIDAGNGPLAGGSTGSRAIMLAKLDRIVAW
jgi:hypothetical protein